MTTVSRIVESAALARAGYGALLQRPPGEAVNWERKNYRGRVVTLLQGPAAALATASPSLAAGRCPHPVPRGTRAAAALTAAAAAASGAYDDFAGSAERGIRAHLRALRERRITSGAVRAAAVGGAALAAGALVRRRPADRLLAAAVIAGGAHAANVFDTRPGRAAKAVLLASAPMLATGNPVAPATAGAAAALLPEELAERCMLGDCGAQALGASWGLAAALRTPRAGLAALAAGLAALAVVEERSGSRAVGRAVERWSWAARLDAAGRRHPGDAPAPPPEPVGCLAVDRAEGAAGPVRRRTDGRRPIG